MDEKEGIKPSVSQEQVHDILFSREIGWQEIIYDLINTEQLDPWDIDITLLAEKFLERIRVLEESDFFISSKVLLAASLLLRIKSEYLLNKYIKSIDDILFGKKEEKPAHKLERMELEEEIPHLIPRSPMPRFKRVTLEELMESLNKAITTENRRIKKEIIMHNALRESSISLPKKTISITDKIKEVFEKIFSHLNPKHPDKKQKVTFTELIGNEKGHRIGAFYPLLQLENNQKVWLHQDAHFEEIYIWLKEIYIEHHGDPFSDLKEALEEITENLDKEGKKRVKKIETKFKEPINE
jgi:segregation and condensation protein A